MVGNVKRARSPNIFIYSLVAFVAEAGLIHSSTVTELRLEEPIGIITLHITTCTYFPIMEHHMKISKPEQLLPLHIAARYKHNLAFALELTFKIMLNAISQSVAVPVRKAECIL